MPPNGPGPTCHEKSALEARLVELESLGVLGDGADLALVEANCVCGLDLDADCEVGVDVCSEVSENFVNNVFEVECDLVCVERLDAVEPGLRVREDDVDLWWRMNGRVRTEGGSFGVSVSAGVSASV